MSNKHWLEALRAAKTDADALAAIAVGLTGADAELPTGPKLLNWWPETPKQVRAEAEARLRALVLCCAHAVSGGAPEFPPDLVDAIAFRPAHPDVRANPKTADSLGATLPFLAEAPGGGHRWFLAAASPLALTRAWIAARKLDGCPDHPLSPVVRAWQNRPPQVKANKRPDPIIPAIMITSSPERDAGRLAFGGILDDRNPDDAQLPLLPTTEGPRVALLELADFRGIPTMAKGRGAPLDLRLAVAACLLTPNAARASRGRLAVTVRELRDFLFPNGWQRGRDWPRIRQALWRARDYVLPDRAGGLWLPFALRRDPGRDAALDDLILIDIELPPGAVSGPPIDRKAVAHLGVQSAPRFRAHIAAHSVAWIPGITRVKVPRTAVRVWAGDTAKYPVLTAGDRDRLAFGTDNAVRKRGRAEKDAAWIDLPGVNVVSRNAVTPDGQVGWIVVPRAAAEAIRRRAGGPT